MTSEGRRAQRSGRRSDHRGRLPALALALAAALPLAAAPAAAEPEETVVPRRETARAGRQLELGAADVRPRPLAWMGENLHIQKGTGLEYRRRVQMGERRIELGVQGPVVRKKKSVGLTLVVRF